MSHGNMSDIEKIFDNDILKKSLPLDIQKYIPIPDDVPKLSDLKIVDSRIDINNIDFSKRMIVLSDVSIDPDFMQSEIMQKLTLDDQVFYLKSDIKCVFFITFQTMIPEGIVLYCVNINTLTKGIPEIPFDSLEKAVKFMETCLALIDKTTY